MMLRNVVVFPAPLRPTRQTSSPAATDRLMPLRMRLPSISTFRLDKLSITTTFSKPCSNSCSNPCSSSWARSHHGRYHGWVGEEGVGWHVGEKNACLQRDDAMRIPLNEVHVVLDLDDSAHARRPGGGDENFHDGMLVTARNAAGRLVQQDDGGIERKGAGDIEQFFLALRKCRRDGIELGTQPQDFSDALGIRLEYRIPLQGAKRIGHAAQARRDRDAKRFPYRQSGKDIDQLKRARHSEPCKLDRPMPAISRPRKRTSPAVGRSRPVTTLTSVVLPAPFGPTIETNSPSLTPKEMSRRALNAPKDFETLMVSNSGAVPGTGARSGCISPLCIAPVGEKLDRSRQTLRHENHE